MNDPAREAILSAVGRAVSGDQETPAAPEPTTPLEVNWLEPGSGWDEAKASLEALGDTLTVVADRDELAQALESLVNEHGVTKAVRWDHPLLEQAGIDDLLAKSNVEVQPINQTEDLRGFAATAELGITALDAMVVRSGTLAMRCEPGMERSVSLLPEVHLALVTREQCLGSIADLVPLLHQWRASDDGLPSAVTLVTGHSRTADIELILVSGVHGPKFVHVIALDFDLGE